MNTKEILNENKLLMDEFINTASEKELQEVLKFISHLNVNINIEDRNISGRWEQQELEEPREMQLDTWVEVQGILNSLSSFELAEVEDKIRSNLQKGNTSKEAFDILKV